MKKNIILKANKKADKDTTKNFDHFDGFVSKHVVGKYFGERLSYWTKKLRGV